MPIGTYTMLKGTEPAFEEKASANYYAYGPSGSVATYKKISGLITLPDKVRLVGTGKGRNAFISLGVTAKGGKRGIDIGLRNRGLGCQNKKLGIDIPSKDAGYGWHPYCIELDNSIDAGYYFDGQKNIHKTDKVSQNTAYFAPSNAKQARFEIVPNTNGKSVHFTVTWLDANGTQVGTVFDKVINLEGTYQWDNFCRFASLVTPDKTATMTDSTYVVNGGFATLKIGSANWGITTTQVPLAWIMNEPKCKLISKWAVGESFTIDHWA